MSVIEFSLVLFSAFLHGLWNFFAKKAPQKHEIVTAGICVGVIVFFPGLFLFPIEVTWIGLGLVIATGIIQGIYILLLYQAYRRSGLTIVYPLTRGIGVLSAFVLEIFLLATP